MYQIKQTPQFVKWITNIADLPTKLRLLRRLEKAQRGLLGDVSPVGDGVFEMREFFGPGWRMYYVQQGDSLIIMLGGGSKSGQSKDITAAKELAVKLEQAK